MKALISALALMGFVAASTIPFVAAPAQAQTTTTKPAKKSTKKKKSTAKKKTAASKKKKTAKTPT